MTWDDEIEADLFSGQPARVAEGLRTLRSLCADVAEWEMRPFGVELFDPFQAVPTELQAAFLYVVIHHTRFVPPLTPEQRIRTMISLLVRYGDRAVAHEIALELKIARDKTAAVRTAMEEALRHDARHGPTVDGVSWLASDLLDGRDEVRDATLAALSRVATTPLGAAVVEYVLPKLDDEARTRLGRP
jgi:hypothetical protein